MDQPSPPTPQLLFLDDAPDRAAVFLAAHPGAVWVQTAVQCLELLEKPWDEVHLDHDLGGEVLVDHERADCGMAVVRWLCEEPRPHLRDTRFIIHTHNPNAACYDGLAPAGDGFAGPGKPVWSRDHDGTRCKPRIPGWPAAPLAGATHRDHRLIGVGGRIQIHAKVARTSRGRVPGAGRRVRPIPRCARTVESRVVDQVRILDCSTDLVSPVPARRSRSSAHYQVAPDIGISGGQRGFAVVREHPPAGRDVRLRGVNLLRRDGRDGVCV